jgi:AcrR family transcriptional regulator
MKTTASDRLIATASRLFQERGYALVGINEIIAAAGVARMSLYNNFSSKEDLAVAAYRSVSLGRRESFDAAIAEAPSPEDAVVAIFDLARKLAEMPGFRGCSFINLAAHIGPEEQKLVAVVTEHKTALRERLEAVVAEAGVLNARGLAIQLLNLWDGAIVEAAIMRSVEPIEAAIDAARALLQSARSGSLAPRPPIH